MKFVDIIAVIAAALSLAATLEGYLDAEFSTKLIVLALVAIVLFWVATRRLADWVKPKRGTGVTAGEARRSKLKIFLAVLALLVLGIALPLAAYGVNKLYAINIELITATEGAGVSVKASRPIATKLTLSVPPSNKGFDCWPVQNQAHRAQTTMLQWDGLEPHLQISNFRYPQEQSVLCQPAALLNDFRYLVEPPNLEVLLPERRSSYQSLFCWLGGGLCVLGLIWFFVRSR